MPHTKLDKHEPILLVYIIFIQYGYFFSYSIYSSLISEWIKTIVKFCMQFVHDTKQNSYYPIPAMITKVPRELVADADHVAKRCLATMTVFTTT